MERTISKARETKLRKLAKLFNKFSVNPPLIVKELLICLDISVTPEETEFFRPNIELVSMQGNFQ